jgi:hypothetical protein
MLYRQAETYQVIPNTTADIQLCIIPTIVALQYMTWPVQLHKSVF